jgi:hypothetical protein
MSLENVPDKKNMLVSRLAFVMYNKDNNANNGHDIVEAKEQKFGN